MTFFCAQGWGRRACRATVCELAATLVYWRRTKTTASARDHPHASSAHSVRESRKTSTWESRISFTRTFSEGDMSLFIGATWDVNPYHTDERFASHARFGRRILPGPAAGQHGHAFGRVMGISGDGDESGVPGPGLFGDTVTIEVEIMAIDEPRQKVQARCRWVNADGVEVLRGSFAGYPSDA